MLFAFRTPLQMPRHWPKWRGWKGCCRLDRSLGGISDKVSAAKMLVYLWGWQKQVDQTGYSLLKEVLLWKTDLFSSLMCLICGTGMPTNTPVAKMRTCTFLFGLAFSVSLTRLKWADKSSWFIIVMPLQSKCQSSVMAAHSLNGVAHLAHRTKKSQTSWIYSTLRSL